MTSESNDDERRSSVEVVKSFLIQILDALSETPEILNTIMDLCNNSTQHRATDDCSDSLWSALKRVIPLIPKQQIVLVVDGIDEIFSEQQMNLIHNILSVLNYDPRQTVQVKILLTSRLDPVFKEFDSHPSISLHTLCPTHTAPDIAIYVRNAIETNTLLGALAPRLREDIISCLVNKSCGMFLWARLMIQDLQSQKSHHDIQRMLTRLPSGMRGTLKRIIGKMEEDGNGIVIFQYLASAFRPLTLAEFTDLLEVDIQDTDYNPQRKLLIPVDEYIQQECNGLVTCDNGHIQFIHQSVKEFLVESKALHLNDCHSRMAAICLTYASFHRNGDSSHQDTLPSDQFQHVKRKHSLLGYSILNWARHAQISRAGRESSLASIVVDAVLRADRLTWMEKVCYARELSVKEATDRHMNALQIRREIRGVYDEETTRTALEMGALLLQQGRVKMSEELLSKLLVDVPFTAENWDLKLAAMKGIARSLERQNDWVQAESQYRFCMNYCHEMKASSEQVAYFGNGLAWTLKAQGRMREAREMYEKTYFKARRDLGPGHREVRLAATELAHCHEKEGSDDQAYTVLKQELDDNSSAFGIAHQAVTRASLELLDFLERSERWHDAEAIARSHIRSTQPSDIPSLDITTKLASYLDRRGNFQEAEDILLPIWNLLKMAQGRKFGDFLRASLALANLYEGKSEWDKAIKIYEMSRTVLERLSEESLLVIDSSQAKCLEKSNRLSDAQGVYERVFKISEAKFGLNNRKTIDAGERLATFFERIGRLEDALEVYNRMLAFCAETLGEDHRYTIANLVSLAAFHKKMGVCEAAVQSSGELLERWAKNRGVHYYKLHERMEEE
jgi:tetratricopeptide (TPR) repeat protein